MSAPDTQRTKFSAEALSSSSDRRSARSVRISSSSIFPSSSTMASLWDSAGSTVRRCLSQHRRAVSWVVLSVKFTVRS